ncbi:DUF308 domain-containing protein [Roseovarius pelagicus]|uniref:DUF308 domain-containing protein n=1 Tax=Roseovarius pelagicus TaxID=2980108 RepID=A0ABY6DA22_9RHOB|nr:DUF308 domain-containing protein [Roseovarius pelagicus]UXX82994.1 DUF308 domain-containing protein [Roseovarius pelagicus]
MTEDVSGERPDEVPGDGTRTVFVERSAYRRRRMTDAASLLPILGVVLFLVPLLWQGDSGSQTTDVMLYIFGIWALLAGLSGLISRDLGRDRSGGGTGPGRDSDADTDADKIAGGESG